MTATNAPISPLPPGAGPAVVSSIRQAAAATDMDFGLLMAQAQQESGFQPQAKASGSSATGLFQFIDSTWLGMVRQFGDKYGVGPLARQITVDASGRARVTDPAARQRILDLRTDPRLSAMLAGEYTRLNKTSLEQALGRPAGNADLYMAHFLGAGGAISFLKAAQQAGGTVAADLMPDAAAANRAVFYDEHTGRPRTVAEIYQTFSNRIDTEANRFAAAAPAPGATSAGAAAVSPLIRSLRLDSHQLTQPMTAMLNLFALSTLQLLGGSPPPRTPHPGLRSI